MEPTKVQGNEPNKNEVFITIPTIKIDNWLIKYLKSIWFWFTISSVMYIGYNLAGYPVHSECWNDERTTSAASSVASVFGFFTPLGLGFRDSMMDQFPFIFISIGLQGLGVLTIFLMNKFVIKAEWGFLKTIFSIVFILMLSSIVGSLGISIAILLKGEYPAFCM